MSGPLAGIRIIDCSQIVSGPMACQMLGDQGAEVIKVESPGGDPVRGLGPKKADLSSMFIAVNRGKQGLCLDLKSPEGIAVLERLVATADVLVENFRPGVLARLGLGWDRLQAINPRLIYCSITGFGPDGPYQNIRVYDPVIQAVSGIAATQVDKEGTPGLVRHLVADKVTALTAAQAITAALFRRERAGGVNRDGQGERIEVAMLDAAVAFNWPDSMYNLAFLDDAPATWPEYGAQMRLWKAADGQVAIGALQDAEFVALTRSLGREDLATDERFRSSAGRIKHQREWAPQVSAEIAKRTRAELMEGFVEQGAVGGPVVPLADVPNDAQVQHNRICIEVAHSEKVGRVRQARPPARFGQPLDPVGPAPHLGEHGRQILAALGYDPAAIAALVDKGVLRA
ncbi:CaiB/BaiF CoA transferase family protein [Sandarakinorhabdus oryzae]|uniref:CaiB/BaiF CoA transferase family protein n=1 Tax=Sandarakinorhabdus oryzae TaxID=2675220 RepID=UPI0012E20EEA|nr:CoA transferase [Sandarakinorhabdus oryzae]